METTYKLTSDKLSGHLEVAYEDGLLKRFVIAVKPPLTPRQYGVFISSLNPNEERVKDFEEVGLKVLPVAVDKTNDKIALFCRLYERFVGVKYKVSRADAGK